MNKWVIAIVVLIVVGVLVNTYAPVPGGTQEDQTLSQGSPFPLQVIEMTQGGFVPQNIVIPVGTTVRFINSDTSPHWPASGARPNEDVCPGFDSFHPMVQGEVYEFTFREIKICPMHDHLNPSFTGIITVENPFYIKERDGQELKP